MTDNPIRTERRGHVLEVTLDRPKANAIDLETSRLMGEVFASFRDDPGLRVALLTGAGDRFFCPGWDLKAAAEGEAVDSDYGVGGFGGLQELPDLNKPVIAAVNGFALGGGCELMMHCDVIICSETARIGQPEINIGVMPGAGGTQRLTRAVGKAAAMDIVLSGRFLSAKEALKFGLVSRVVPKEHWFEESLNIAKQVATKGPIALRAAKASVLNAEEMNLSDGLSEERQLFYSLFDTNDQTEGMTAFIEKRNPNWVETLD